MARLPCKPVGGRGGHHPHDDVVVGRQNGASHSNSLNSLGEASSAFSQVIDKKDGDSRTTIRENTFVTDENSLPINIMSPRLNGHRKGTYPIVDTNAQISLLAFPPPTVDLQLSRYKRLNFDQIKTDLTATRRGVFIIQALRWVSTNEVEDIKP